MIRVAEVSTKIIDNSLQFTLIGKKNTSLLPFLIFGADVH